MQLILKKVGRFQVMAVLQAARAKRLGLSDTRAKSWGLNRAIFYAAAKRGFKTQARAQRRSGHAAEKVGNTFFLGDEMAYTSKKGTRLYFTIGGAPQTEADFRRQIEARFGTHFMKAWEEAISIVNQYDDDVLRSQKRFFNDVYRPRRDELTSKWTAMSG
jgi:hypothetical protein